MITIKTKQEIETLREGGKILSNILKEIIKRIHPGTLTGDLEILALDMMKAAGGRPSFKGYQSVFDSEPYPTALCISINNEVVHAPALPSRELFAGDIVSLDIGMEYPHGSEAKGLYTDMAATVPVGKISKEAARLISVTRQSLEIGISQVKPGNSLNDIGENIENYVKSQGFNVVRELVGHGVGYDVHEEPQIPNYAFDENEDENAELKSGMVLAIEPMVNTKGWRVKTKPDGFTIVTADRSLSAHFEHTVAVTEKGHIVLTE